MGEPLFPQELEREIFEHTALMHRGTIPTLLRVARRVLTWIEPLLYRVIRVGRGHEHMVQALLNLSKGARTPHFLHKAVHHLALDHVSLDEGTEILRLCTGVINFACSTQLVDPSFVPILAELGVQRLALCLQALFGGAPINLTHSLFRSVTHLDILGVVGVESALAEISALPALTHLCLDPAMPWDVLTKVLEDCPRLELLLVQWSIYNEAQYISAQEPCLYDLRLVIGLYYGYWEEWEAEANGVLVYWAEADDFVARKRRGEIEATRYWIHQEVSRILIGHIDEHTSHNPPTPSDSPERTSEPQLRITPHKSRSDSHTHRQQIIY
ncbi:hypothetical protein B0H14DRAFT_3871403 [Mycena olivaceomarginata]|nr:hypothetical protein B0H14DRAFT_3871403 [Mycena olivaceomarginata]